MTLDDVGGSVEFIQVAGGRSVDKKLKGGEKAMARPGTLRSVEFSDEDSSCDFIQ